MGVSLEVYALTTARFGPRYADILPTLSSRSRGRLGECDLPPLG